MADELKDQRIITLMTPTELEAIDDWMFANRVRSRGEAIRRLVQFALIVDEHMPGVDQLRQQALEKMDDLRDAVSKARSAPGDGSARLSASALDTVGVVLRQEVIIGHLAVLRDALITSGDFDAALQGATNLNDYSKEFMADMVKGPPGREPKE